MSTATGQDERDEQARWPRDTSQYTFIFRALHSLGRQMLNGEWPSSIESMFNNENLPAIANSLQRSCESGQAWAAIQMPTGQMFHLTRSFMSTSAFGDAIMCGKTEVDADIIAADDYRPISEFIGTQQWLFIENREIRAEPPRFDGVLIDQDLMQMPLWSIGMALVWIAYRSPDKMREICSMPLQTLLLSDGDGTPPEVIAARHALLCALATGGITATGRAASGGRREIDKLEWADLQLFTDDLEGGLEYCAFGQERDGSGRPLDASYHKIRIERDQLIANAWSLPLEPIPQIENGMPDGTSKVRRSKFGRVDSSRVDDNKPVTGRRPDALVKQDIASLLREHIKTWREGGEVMAAKITVNEFKEIAGTEVDGAKPTWARIIWNRDAPLEWRKKGPKSG